MALTSPEYWDGPLQLIRIRTGLRGIATGKWGIRYIICKQRIVQHGTLSVGLAKAHLNKFCSFHFRTSKLVSQGRPF